MHDLEQFISRGSRSQGIAKGLIIIQDPESMSVTQAYKGIEARNVMRSFSYLRNLELIRKFNQI